MYCNRIPHCQVIYLRYNEQTGVPVTPYPVKQASRPNIILQGHVSYAGAWTCIRVAEELVQDGGSWDPPQTDQIRASAGAGVSRGLLLLTSPLLIQLQV